MAVGDVDGDGRVDILSSQYRHDSGDGDNHGAARLIKGRARPTTLRVLDVAMDAAWSYEHGQSNDLVGFSVALRDLDGDQRADVLLGNLDDEGANAPNRSGTVMAFVASMQGELPRQPTFVLSGASPLGQLGSAVAAVPDTDGDGMGEVIAFASGDDRFGPEVGSPLVYPSASTPYPLSFPGLASGAGFGRSVAAIGDVTGDGAPDVVVGAPATGSRALGRNAGVAYLFEPEGSFEPSLFAEFRGHSTADELGREVAGIGDFDGDGVSDFAVAARLEDRPSRSSFDAATYEVDPSCPSGGGNNVGAVYIFRGARGARPSPQPSFVVYGPDVGDGVESIAKGPLDFNGDGRDDLAFGAPTWDRTGAGNSGGVAVVFGRPLQGFGKTSVICNLDFVFRGRSSNDNLGFSLAAAGDLDGDGCHELAAGAPGSDSLEVNGGSVTVLFGHRGAGCPGVGRRVDLATTVRNARAGSALAGGWDADGDARPDMVVGLPGFDNGESVGGAAFVRGGWLGSLATVAVTSTVVEVVAFPTSASGTLVAGTDPAGAAGTAVSLVDGQPALMAMGAPAGDLYGGPGSGWVAVYEVGTDGTVAARPRAGLVGESSRAGGAFGSSLDFVRFGARRSLIVGAPLGSRVATDNGATYVFELEP